MEASKIKTRKQLVERYLSTVPYRQFMNFISRSYNQYTETTINMLHKIPIRENDNFELEPSSGI